jgi:hypothetical protein
MINFYYKIIYFYKSLNFFKVSIFYSLIDISFQNNSSNLWYSKYKKLENLISSFYHKIYFI